MKVVSKRVETEAMQWSGHGSGWPIGLTALTTFNAEQIVAWVNANGGEAYYQAGGPRDEYSEPRIMVRTNSGWAPVAPGWWVVMGDEWIGHVGEDFVGVRDFYPCDPDTFATRWDVQ